MEAIKVSLKEFCLSSGLTVKFRHVGFVPKSKDNDWEHNAWKVTVSYQGRRLATDYKTGAAIVEPTAPDVIYGLLMDARLEGSFEDFCGDLGYDPDSRQAEKIYKACVRMAPKVRRLLGANFEAFESAAQEY